MSYSFAANPPAIILNMLQERFCNANATASLRKGLNRQTKL
jgi:hypothetical protein